MAGLWVKTKRCLTLSLRAPLIGGTREMTCGYEHAYTITRRLLDPAPHISDIQMMHIQVLSVVNNIFFRYRQNIFCWFYWHIGLIASWSYSLLKQHQNVSRNIYYSMLKNLLNPSTVKRYFIYGSYKNCCYLRFRETYIQQPRTLCVFLARVSVQWRYFRSEKIKGERRINNQWWVEKSESVVSFVRECR